MKTMCENMKKEIDELKQRLEISENERSRQHGRIMANNIRYHEIDQTNAVLRRTLERIREIVRTVILVSNCSNCDGVGYYDGCEDENCGEYAVRKIFDVINEVLKEE